MMSLYRTVTMLLVFSLFTIGSMSVVGPAFAGFMHWVVHFATYALLALVFALGWQDIRPIYVVAIVSAIGLVHELSEIITHSHGFEYMDAIVDGFGALLGMIILSGLRKFGQNVKL